MRRIPAHWTKAASIAAAVLLALSFASCSKSVSSPASPSSSSGTTAPATLDAGALEQQTHSKINAYRASAGLAALAWSDAIASAARQHSSNMASGAAGFGHDGFSSRVAAIALVLPVAGAAENVAMASGFADPVGAVVQGWLDSPTHKPNIEGSFGLTGVGVAVSATGSIYFTQIFVTSK